VDEIKNLRSVMGVLLTKLKFKKCNESNDEINLRPGMKGMLTELNKFEKWDEGNI